MADRPDNSALRFLAKSDNEVVLDCCRGGKRDDAMTRRTMGDGRCDYFFVKRNPSPSISKCLKIVTAGRGTMDHLRFLIHVLLI